MVLQLCVGKTSQGAKGFSMQSKSQMPGTLEDFACSNEVGAVENQRLTSALGSSHQTHSLNAVVC
jgi:hypothetical protein